MSAAPLPREALDALIEVQKASDAIGAVLDGAEDKLHANGLSGTLWAIEAIIVRLAQHVDPVIENALAEQRRDAREVAHG